MPSTFIGTPGKDVGEAFKLMHHLLQWHDLTLTDFLHFPVSKPYKLSCNHDVGF